jgi:hypothetical protein
MNIDDEVLEFSDKLDPYTFITGGRKTGKSTKLAERAFYELERGFDIVLVSPTLQRSAHLLDRIRRMSNNNFNGRIKMLSGKNVVDRGHGWSDKIKWFWDDINEYPNEVQWKTGHYYTEYFD